MRYDVRVSGKGGFELERDKPFEVGETFTQFTMIYVVTSVLPGHDDFDFVIEVAERGGPGKSKATRPLGSSRPPLALRPATTCGALLIGRAPEHTTPRDRLGDSNRPRLPGGGDSLAASCGCTITDS